MSPSSAGSVTVELTLDTRKFKRQLRRARWTLLWHRRWVGVYAVTASTVALGLSVWQTCRG